MHSQQYSKALKKRVKKNPEEEANLFCNFLAVSSNTLKRIGKINLSICLLQIGVQNFYVRKTWPSWCREPFLMKENWHEIKDHGFVSVEMAFRCEFIKNFLCQIGLDIYN